MRRIRPTPGSQLPPDVVFDYHAILTDRTEPMLRLEADHCRRAVVELAIRDLKARGHITTLLLTFFYRLTPKLIEKGHLYLAQPPLYQLRRGSTVAYAMSDPERKQLWATTMDPQRRTLLRVNIEDAARADELFVLLRGNQTDPRRE